VAEAVAENVLFHANPGGTLIALAKAPILGAFMAIWTSRSSTSSLKGHYRALVRLRSREGRPWIPPLDLVAEIIIIPLAAWLAVVMSAAALCGGRCQALFVIARHCYAPWLDLQSDLHCFSSIAAARGWAGP